MAGKGSKDNRSPNWQKRRANWDSIFNKDKNKKKKAK